MRDQVNLDSENVRIEGDFTEMLQRGARVSNNNNDAEIDSHIAKHFSTACALMSMLYRTATNFM